MHKFPIDNPLESVGIGKNFVQEIYGENERICKIEARCIIVCACNPIDKPTNLLPSNEDAFVWNAHWARYKSGVKVMLLNLH